MNNLLQKAEVVYGWFLTSVNSLQSPFLLAIRLFWGWQFWQSGWAHLSDLPKFVDYFTGLGIPAPSLNAHFIAVLEAGGGILLALGLGSRLISFLLAGDMFVAFVVAAREALKFILIFGPGKISLDHVIAVYRKKHPKTGAATAS